MEAPQSEEEEPTVEEPKGPTPEEIERLRIATELNQFRYVGFMAVGGGSQKKKNMAVVVKNDEMHVVQVGEVIAGEVLVKAVSMSEITVSYTHLDVYKRQSGAKVFSQVLSDPGGSGDGPCTCLLYTSGA